MDPPQDYISGTEPNQEEYKDENGACPSDLWSG
jgi:hypothetical protein